MGHDECPLGITKEDRDRLIIMMDQHYTRVMPTLFGDGNGKEGLLSKIEKYLVKEDVDKEEIKEKEDKEKKWNRRLMLAIAVIMAIIAMLDLHNKIEIHLGSNPSIHFSQEAHIDTGTQISNGQESYNVK